MLRHRFPRAALVAVLLIALCLPAGLAEEALKVTFKNGRMSWNAISFANVYYYRACELTESKQTTATSVDIDAYLDGLIEAGALQNTGEHDLHLEAYNTETFDTVTWAGSYKHLHPTLPRYEEPEVVEHALRDSVKYDAGTGVLSWKQRSNLTDLYWYSVEGQSLYTDQLSVNLHSYIDSLVTKGDIPYAERFRVELTANRQNGDQLEAWTTTIDYVPHVARIDVNDSSTIVNGVQGEYAWTGAAIRPAVSDVAVLGKALKEGTDYTVAYGANTDPGAGAVLITGKGRYKGTVTVSFTITAPDATEPPTDVDETPVSLAGAKIGVKAATWTGKALKPAVTVKLNGQALRKGTDYTVSYKNNKAIGKATVTITGRGGYTGTAKATFRINPKAPAGLKLAAGKKRLTAGWKKVAGVTGYQVQYAANKRFKGAKAVAVKGQETLKTVIKKLKAGATYWVRVRSYKVVKKTRYYSAWSRVKSMKAK